MFNAKEQYLLANFVVVIFLCLLFRCVPICNDMGLFTHGGLLQVSCNLFFGENVRDSPLFMQNSFTMPKNNEFANKVKNSSHVSTSAYDTGKENVFESAKVLGVIPKDVFKLNPEHNYCIVNAVGNCLDHELSPIKIKDGDRLLIHQVSLDMFSLLKTVRKVVCFMLNNGKCFVKQVVYYDVEANGVRVRMFNPEEHRFFIPVSEIKALFIVDKVLSAEYVSSFINQ